MSAISSTPLPPYYAVIFTSIKSDIDEGYDLTSRRMIELASAQPGFLGVESARQNIGITVSYWRSLDDIQRWKNNAEHLFAQSQGRNLWYRSFKVRICLVEHEYGFTPQSYEA